MKLYAIKKVDGHYTITNEVFENKPAAKVRRDELNGGKWENLEAHQREYKVTRGPDHRLGLAGLIPPTRAGAAGGKKRSKATR